MPIEFLERDNKEIWNLFVEKSPQGSIFCKYEWLEFSTKNNFVILVYKENSNIVAGMPLPFFYEKKIRLPRLTQKMGVLFCDFSCLKYSTRLEKEKLIIGSFLDFIEKYKLSYTMNFDWNYENWLPFYWHNYDQTTRYTYVIDYKKQDLDEIWKNMDQNTRNVIKKADKNGLKVYRSYDIKKFYDYNKKTFERQRIKIPYSYEYVKSLFSQFQENSYIFEAKDDENNTHAMNFYIKDLKSVYYLMSGADEKFRGFGAQDYIQWYAIRYYYDKTLYFDFEGSMIESIESNFRKFGAVQKQYFTIRKKSILNNIKEIARIVLKRYII